MNNKVEINALLDLLINLGGIRNTLEETLINIENRILWIKESLNELGYNCNE